VERRCSERLQRESARQWLRGTCIHTADRQLLSEPLCAELTLIMSSARAVDHGVPIGAVRMAVGGTAMSLCEAISCSASVGATAVVKCERLGACRP
jgi:hypothetical protein